MFNALGFDSQFRGEVEGANKLWKNVQFCKMKWVQGSNFTSPPFSNSKNCWFLSSSMKSERKFMMMFNEVS